MSKYTVGIDFGTLSGRALLVDIETGAEIASAVIEYPHKVMDQTLPNGRKLPPDWALQHPQDYLDVIERVIPEVLEKSGVSAENIIGLGVDFTASTVIPVKDDGTPLCFLPEYGDNPHAYVKLWKHHAAQEAANRLNALAETMDKELLERYGGKFSSEWLIPKVCQICEEAPEIYDAADCFIEAGDWIIWRLTGKLSRSACQAGYKAMWSKRAGYPGKALLKALNPKLENLVGDKLKGDVLPLGSRAGEISENSAKITGLPVGCAVSVGIIDGHACVPAAKLDGAGKVLMIFGTSSCHFLLSDKEKYMPGVCGVVEDGIYPGYFAYEAGQCCTGDHFAWFIDNCLPESYRREASEQGKSIHAFLREKAQKLKPGESGLIALDWWNGNRSVLMDSSLTGLLVGMTLQTKPEDIYRALIEATAFGTRKIIETFVEGGVNIDEICISGNISQKDPMAMQIYADVLKIPVKIAGSMQSAALGSAILAAVAAGGAAGGYDETADAVKHMGSLSNSVYRPISENAAVYDMLYDEYNQLHDYFGRGSNDIMKRLKNIRRGQA